ncbi:uncharacterized protein RSE6_02620 [Rhynchosporium secalis]|uniref:Uncharacterized protein n=1 Tax=Rhynchosporium secalis TaxID=38038 RepID=A0A1E1M0M8_RHYSE|nr:uncharacterized protein RSE6_02620 [Rhynchosporium secalis]
MITLVRRLGGSEVASASGKDQSTTAKSMEFEAANVTAHSATLSSNSVTISTSANDSKSLIIGVMLSATGALLLLALLVVFCIQQRKKRQARKMEKGAQPTAYSGLNDAFGGVAFQDSQHNSLSPQSLLLSRSNKIYSGAPSPSQRPSEMIGLLHQSNRDVSSPQQSPRHSPPSWPPQSPAHAYSSQQSRTRSHAHVRRYSYITHARMHSRTISRAESNSSPLTLNDPCEAHVLSGNGTCSPTELEAAKFQATPVQERDTMGFPVEQSAIIDDIELQPMTPVLHSPKPKRPLAHQDSLERMIREGNSAPSPAPSNSAPGRDRRISQECRESPILGVLNPMIIQNATLTRLGDRLGRSDSHKTVASVSTMGPVIGDEELERLGVGIRPPPLRLRNDTG